MPPAILDMRPAGFQPCPITCYESAEGDKKYNSTPYLTEALFGGGWPSAGYFTACCTGSWLIPSTGLDWCGNSRLLHDSIPGPSVL